MGTVSTSVNFVRAVNTSMTELEYKELTNVL